jgi:hypothetical protein
MGSTDVNVRIALDDALQRLAAMPAFVAAAIDAASGDELLFRPGEGEFSLTEQACHLRDLEREGYLERVRRILAEDVPALDSFDGDAVAAARDYPSQDARAAARDFAAARREVVALLQPAGAAQLARAATFDGRRITLHDVVGMMVEHDRGHREEIEAIVEALESP